MPDRKLIQLPGYDINERHLPYTKHTMDYVSLSHTHDLSLPSWGPYSNSNFGLSHIHDPLQGARVDFVLMPGFYRRPLAIPDARRPSGGLPWQCDVTLQHYSYRQQLEWKDRIYAEFAYDEIASQCHRLRCTLVNHTEGTQELAVQLVAQLLPRTELTYGCPQAVKVLSPRLSNGRGLETDAMHTGEKASAEAILEGTVYPLNAGMTAHFDLAQIDVSAYDFYLYCRSAGDSAWHWEKKELSGKDAYRLTAQQHIIINRMVAVPRGVVPTIEKQVNTTPIQVETIAQGRYLLRFPGNGDVYGIVSAEKPSFHRNYRLEHVQEYFTYRDSVLQKHLGESIPDQDGPQGAFAIAIQPIPCQANSEKAIDFLVWNGKEEEVRSQLAKTTQSWNLPSANYLTFPDTPYHFSVERMASVVMTNIVYPIRCQGRFIRNHTPGRLWNSLYTWDSGFIGLGLLELDVQRAIENLNAYLTPVGDAENAFVLHGTPLPMQIFLLFELWNRTTDREMLRAFYPRCKQMYDYLAGHAPGSTTRKHCTAPLLCSWDYFYNSGGWDDYPPQWERSYHPSKNDVIPVVTTAIAIRAAKLLRSLAQVLGEPTDQYTQDIQDFSQALQQFSWDERSGYFSYVVVDNQKQPIGFFQYHDGSNYNMGLDGTSPLVADCVTPEQKQTLWDKLQSPEHLWCPYGISTVDQSAAYFQPDGYWNGSVWMPHQWLLWKAALCDGMSDFADKIAQTALELWERETQRTYACLEQFSVTNGTGMGWHHFSGLSSPILCWHAAYYTPGKLTAGYDVRVDQTLPNGWKLTILGAPGQLTTLIIGGSPVSITYNGQPIPFTKTFGNSVKISLEKNTSGPLILEENGH